LTKEIRHDVANDTTQVSQAHETMQKMPLEYNSALACLICGVIQTHVALETGDKEMIDRALVNIRASKIYAHGSPFAEGSDLFAHIVAIKLSDEAAPARSKLKQTS
jgi:hypothetical protein